MELTTERLKIREINEKDIPNIVENVNDYEVTKNLLVVPHPYNEKDGEDWIKKCKEKALINPRKDYSMGIELKSENKMIGGITLNGADEFQGTARIGFWLGKKYWGKGIMSEAVQKMLEFAFNELNLRRIEWEVFAGNNASEHMAKKFGFKFEGTKRKGGRSKATGKIHDEKKYGLLKEEWQG